MAKARRVEKPESQMIVSNVPANLAILTEEDGIPHYLFKADRVTKTNCKLCNAPCRDEAEIMYASQKRKNYSEIQRRLQASHNFDVSVPAIRNHMIYHFNTVTRNANLSEYAEDIQQWVTKQNNQVQAMRNRIAILEREMVTLAEMGDDLELAERRRNAETVKKLAETILTYESKLSEISEQMKPVTMIFNQIKIIATDVIEHSDNTMVRKEFVKFLERLQTSVGDISLQ